MKKAGLIYSFNTNRSAQAADKIANHFGNKVEKVNAEELTEEEFGKYENLILGVPTWFDGELPNYWDELVPALEELKLDGKRIAIFGAGDQAGYPENFVDAIGIMAEFMKGLGAEIVGYTSAEGYTFESSRALKGDKFCGLALDYENQEALSDSRIESWCKQIEKELH